MIPLVFLAGFVIGAADRLRHDISVERRNGWRQALAISAILFLIYAARAVFGGAGGSDCDIRLAVSKDVTAP